MQLPFLLSQYFFLYDAIGDQASTSDQGSFGEKLPAEERTRKPCLGVDKAVKAAKF